MYLLQVWFNLSDPGTEDAIYDSYAMRKFTGIDFLKDSFRIIKCQFGYRKVRYRGLKKNENRLYAMFACANLYLLAMAGRKLQEA